jgi:lipid II:glycine glycyltransferase (peptidoglycan interpeptide bridge formation enzyme)
MTDWQLTEVDPKGEEWHNLLSTNAHLLFHEPLWATVNEEGFSPAKTCCLILQRDGQSVGGMLGSIIRTLWAKLLYINIPYGGVIGQSPPDKKLATLLKDFCKKKGVARVSINAFPKLAESPQDGFRVTPLETAMLELQGRPPEEIWNDYKANIRRDIRKAERNSVTVEEASHPDQAGTFYSLYLDSMRRNEALPKYSPQWVESILKRVVSEGKGTLLLAHREEKPIAGVLIVDSETASHYLLGGSKTEALRYCPNDLLLNAAIMRAAEKGLEYFDFLPSGPDDVALQRFKSKWGSSPFPADACTLQTRPLIMAAWNLAYRLAATRPARAILIARHARRKNA